MHLPTSKWALTNEPLCFIARLIFPVEVGFYNAAFFARKISLGVIPVHVLVWSTIQPGHGARIV